MNILKYRKAYKYVDVSSTMGLKMSGKKLKNSVENMEKKVAVNEENSFLEDLQRVQADFENYIKRVEKEKEQLRLHAKSELLLKIIQVKEDFERAVEKVSDSGVKMIYQQFLKILEEEDVREIEAVGKEFNHVFHEAIKVTDGIGDEIIEEIQKGYMMGNKVLRTSKVILGNNKTGGN